MDTEQTNTDAAAGRANNDWLCFVFNGDDDE